ncbi:MAG: hypothetical protein EOP02_01010 [Proteobacteria bacterium]|nr:MAG: hypothetical protein EOP02_01010 [Pseudomonadota bacterium]
MTSINFSRSLAFSAPRHQDRRPVHRNTVVSSWILAVPLALIGCGGGSDSPTPSDPLSSKTEQGDVQGVKSGNVIVFKGIPYAAPPVGDLRWKAPAPAAVRTAAYTAVTSPAACTASENCLYLNIYKPANATPSDKLPVVMWIHGGGLGSGTANNHDGSTLAEENGLIVVTINYRLGALGFFAHPALTAESGGTSGNYGMLDQQAAMRWIRANIAGFGGDSQNLTIFGQSAGGVSVYTHLASPTAAGLFDKALSFSGGYQRLQPTLATAEGLGQSNATTWGCTGTTTAILSCLRALPVATARTAAGASRGIPSAVIDGKLLRESTTEAFAAGRFNRVPTIVGSTKDETSLAAKSFANAPLTTANWATIASASTRAATADEIASNYDISKYPVPTRAYTEAYGDYRFFCGAMDEAKRVSQWVPQSWAYEFAEQNPAKAIPDSPLASYAGPELSFFGPWGDHHSSDNAYWFGQFQAADRTTSSLSLSSSMRRYLANFARSGNPNGEGLPMWKTVAENAGKVMSLASPLVPDVDAVTKHRCQFWNTKSPSDSLL